MKNEELTLMGKIWYTANNGILLKFPPETKSLQLPIKLERNIMIVIKKDCLELRNVIPK